MKIEIFGKNISLDNALKVFIEDKIGSLEKFLGKGPSTHSTVAQGGEPVESTSLRTGPIEARVEIGLPSKHHRSGNIFYAEVNLKIGSRLLRVACQHEDLRNAIVDVKKELQRQIKKFKDKTTKRRVRKY